MSTMTKTIEQQIDEDSKPLSRKLIRILNEFDLARVEFYNMGQLLDRGFFPAILDSYTTPLLGITLARIVRRQRKTSS